MLTIWIIGSPRSGTTFLTDYIGRYTDKKYNEPWKTHHIDDARRWIFPEVNNIVFKYCENWRNLHILTNLYPNSIYVHVWRDPDNVVHSMAFPKKDSNPPRNLYAGYDGNERVRLCMQRWYSNMMHCLSIFNIIPRQYLEIRYEDPNPGLIQLSEATGLNMNLDSLGFSNRNIETDLDWRLNSVAQNLRDLVKKFDGKCLANWINKRRPKLLQRVVL